MSDNIIENQKIESHDSEKMIDSIRHCLTIIGEVSDFHAHFRNTHVSSEDPLYSMYSVIKIEENGSINGQYFHGEKCQHSLESLHDDDLLFLHKSFKDAKISLQLFDPEGSEILTSPIECQLCQVDDQYNEAFKKWCDKFQNKGYYQSKELGNIELHKLENFCDLSISLVSFQ